MLLRDISIIKEFIPVNASLEYQKLKPFATDAERIIENTIGTEFYSELDNYLDLSGEGDWDDPVPPAEGITAENADKIIALLQDSISYLTFDFGFDVLNTVFSNQGFHRIENEDGSKKSLFQRQEENLRQTFKQQGYNKLEYALAFLETNKDDYVTWADSDAYTMQLCNFINSATEFSKIYNINSNRLVFQKLRSIQNMVEDFDIKPLLGGSLFDEIKTQIAAGTLTNPNNILLGFIKKAVAFRCFFRGGFDLAMEISELGFFQVQYPGGNTDNIKSKTMSAEMINKLTDNAEKNGQAYMRTLESYLQNNAATYPLYTPSEARSIFALSGTDKIGII